MQSPLKLVESFPLTSVSSGLGPQGFIQPPSQAHPSASEEQDKALALP